MKRYIKSSIEIPYNFYDDIEYIFWHYYRDNNNINDIPDLEELQETLDKDINEDEYNQVIRFFENVDKKIDNGEIVFYKDQWGDLYLQLSDRPVFLEFDYAENPIDDQFLYQIENSYIKDFTNKYGVDITLQGRSGKHVCIPYILEHLERYDELQSAWEEYEDKFIEEINSLNVKNSKEEY